MKCADGVLSASGSRYQTILVPATRLMPLPTLEKLVALAKAGATILIQKSLPADVPGFGELEARRARFKKLEAEIGSPTADASGVATAQVGKGRFLIGGDPEVLLARAGVRRTVLVDQGLAFERRAHEGGYVYFLLNRGRAPYAGWVPLPAGADGSWLVTMNVQTPGGSGSIDAGAGGITGSGGLLLPRDAHQQVRRHRPAGWH